MALSHVSVSEMNAHFALDHVGRGGKPPHRRGNAHSWLICL